MGEVVHSGSISSPISCLTSADCGSLLQKNKESTPLFCLQKPFYCTWLDMLIPFEWPMNQKGLKLNRRIVGGEVLEDFAFRGIMLQAFSGKDCTIKSGLGLPDLAFGVIQDDTVLTCHLHEL